MIIVLLRWVYNLFTLLTFMQSKITDVKADIEVCV